MKKLEYTLIAEGYAEYAFIPTYVKRIFAQYNLQAVRSRLGFKGRDAGGSKVLKDAEDICSAAIQQGHQLVILGVDLDAADHDSQQPKHAAKCEVVIAATGSNYKKYSQQILHYVPVQAIEHWMAYQAYKVQLASEFTANSVESKGQAELKQLLYKDKKNGSAMDQIARTIAEKADFDELAKQSRSFSHFHKQITDFLEREKNTSPITLPGWR